MAEHELTEEDVFNDDKDPLEAIREIRKEEGVPDEDLPVSSLDTDTSQSAAPADNKDDDLGELEPGDEPADINESQNGDKKPQEGDDDAKAGDDPNKAASDDSGEEGDDDGEEGVQQAKTEAKAEVGKRKFKANGQEFEFTDEEILEQFETVFGQSMNYTQKMQKIAPYRKMISALEQEGVTQDQLNIALDALKGNKDALQQIIKAHNIEAFDLDSEEESTYQPTPYGKTDGQLDIEEVSAKIGGDKEYPITVDVIDNQWDSKSRSAFASNPELIVGLHNDIKSGKYDEVAPMAMKMKVLDGSAKSDIEYYMLAGEQVRTQEEAAATAKADQGKQQTDELNKNTQAKVTDNEDASSAAQRKRSASSTRTRADRQGVVDYLDDDDEKFDSWYNQLMSSN